MNLLESVQIKGFWATRDLEIDFNPDVNFLVGVNGSGKTTVINMIAATLSADFPNLDRLPFRSIRLQLTQVGGNRKPLIEVKKRVLRHSPYSSIEFEIRDRASDKPTKYSLDELEEERWIRGFSAKQYRTATRRVSRTLVEHIKSLVNVSWLSIHRTPAPHRFLEDHSHESTVDQKVDELSNQFVKYFSLLSRQSTKETEEFQHNIFLSLMSGMTEKQVFSSIKRLNHEQEKNILTEIFRTFGLRQETFSDRVEKHFKLVSKAIWKMDQKDESISLEEFASLLETWRIHSIVQKWNKLSQRRDAIFQPRDTFLQILNGLMQRKQLQINEKNELEVITGSKKKLSLYHLSSGEKQLLIILGEGLLQEQTPWIYIADEPELSLHVKWQEGLINNLRQINPRAQVIFATHSPDIVSTYDDCVFDMEKVLK